MDRAEAKTRIGRQKDENDDAHTGADHNARLGRYSPRRPSGSLTGSPMIYGQKVMDNLDFSRGVQAFLSGMPGASLVGMRAGFQKLGVLNSSILLFENLLDSKSIFLTGNTDSVYFSTWLNLKDGPLVLEAPPKVLAFLDDFWFQYVIDIGNAGPDKGQGGKYLVVPPDFKGEVPEGYFVARSRTYNLWLMGRGFKVDGDLNPGVESIKKNLPHLSACKSEEPARNEIHQWLRGGVKYGSCQ